MKYNFLPPTVVLKYTVEFSELVYEAITIFKNSQEKWGVLKETAAAEFEILIEPVYDSMSFKGGLNYIQAVSYTHGTWQDDGCNYYFYDVTGQLKASVPGVSTVQIDDSGRLLVLKDNCMGVLDNSGKTIIVPSYVSLYHLLGDFYRAQRGGGYGIIDIKERVLLDFKYKYIFSNVKNNAVLVQNQSDRYFSFHFATSELHALPYDRIFPAKSNTYMGGRGEAGLFKAIRQSQETEFDYGDNGMSEYTGVWGMIYADGSTKIPNEYAFVDAFVNPEFFMVAKGKFTFHFDEETNNLIAEGVKWGVVDANNNIIVPIEYDWVQEVGDTIWVVNKGGTVYFNDDYQEEYWTVRGGQLGVYNMHRLITPVAYDTIMTNWFRIKDYVFVQNGQERFNELYDYDVYNFKGERIEVNKPLPRDHIYYK